MIPYLLLTAFTVSIDSFVCGFSLSLFGKRKYVIVLIIALTVFVMCLIANFFASMISEFLNERTAGLGGFILIGVGVYNIVKKEKKAKGGKGIIKQSLLAGFAVGLDGAVANLSLALMGINAFYVPVIIAVMHGIMIAVGIFLANTPISQKLARFHFIPPLILICLGIYKIVGIFL